MIALTDANARAAAIDPCASCCVSAPAGSGKTELLIQRYLGLLSRVDRPEQVLAITFTRKAAAEMRERVLHALRSVHTGDTSVSGHHQVTRALAENALAADRRGEWGLLRDMSRFNIKTIDSFCAGLARQMPVLSQLGGHVDIEDDVTPLYIEAVRELYTLLDEAHPAAADLAALLLHFDNNWDRLQVLLVAMLACREQWRDYVGIHHAPDESAAYLLTTVETLVQQELQVTAGLLAPHASMLLDLLQYAAANLGTDVPLNLPGNTSRELPAWSTVIAMLLTERGDWRKSLTKNQGFPGGKGEAQQRKEQWRELLARLQSVDGLREQLSSIRFLPAVRVDSGAWQMALHLSRLLPTLSAQLLLVFRKHGVVDHSHVAQSALLALGEDDDPTELALRLDYRIEHILVDEFQDTAITQYELLHKLTRGWGEHNAQHPQTPRTLMIVGDGMQSIYGFRGANVGLFLRARLEGFNGVQLRHLELRCNFRSQAGMVEWVNATFARAFPAEDDAARSQVRFSPAIAVRPPGRHPAVAAHGFSGAAAREQEVGFICAAIASACDQHSGTIAVLGRNRSHLEPVIQQLKQMHIPYAAPELDSLAQSPVVADLMTLCRSLANDTDRLAWAALLRAPWCALTLPDLLAVVGAGSAPVWASMQQAARDGQLSDDGRQRLLHTITALRSARKQRDRLSLRVWVEQCWVALGGPGCVTDPQGLQDAESFLQLLEEAEAIGAGLDIQWLSSQVRKRFMASGDPESRVQLLTLHKAKGLEFDQVIIPQLDRPPRRDDREILLWDEHTNARGERAFLLAADDHSEADAPSLYNYLRRQRRQKTLLENTRLLYVGATRAINQLLLTANVTPDAGFGQYRDPPAHSLLRSIWPAFEAQMHVHESPAAQHNVVAPRAFPPLLRLRRPVHELSQYLPSTESTRVSPAVSPPTENHLEKSIGTVVHLALESLSTRAALPETAGSDDQQRWRIALQRLGVWGDALDDALQQVLSAVNRCLSPHGRGRWVLSSLHTAAHSEWGLTIVDATGQIRDIVIDRSFIDATTGERWVIDYKTSRPAPAEGIDAFTARQSAAHCEQLRCYRDAVRSLETAPLRCALFFTALGILHTIPELNLPNVEMSSQHEHSA